MKATIRTTTVETFDLQTLLFGAEEALQAMQEVFDRQPHQPREFYLASNNLRAMIEILQKYTPTQK